MKFDEPDINVNQSFTDSVEKEWSDIQDGFIIKTDGRQQPWSIRR